MTTPRYNRITRGLVLAALLGSSTFPLPAQQVKTSAPTAADPKATPRKLDEAVVLPVFRVDTSQDSGYLATNTTTGTRLNMALKDIPLPIEIITRNFIDDIGAVDIKEALTYSAGVIQDSVVSSNSFLFSPSGSGQANSLSRDNTAISIRGFNTRSFIRSGFRQDTVTDVVNISRQEVARGPQSLLYGVAALGGIVALTPKYPESDPKTLFRLGYGSDDFYRAEIYNTGPIWKSKSDTGFANYGVGLVYQNQSSHSDFDDRRRVLVTPSFEFRPFKDTNLFVDIEYGKFHNTGNGFQDLLNSSSGNVRDPATGLRLAENQNIYGETNTVARDVFGRDRFFRWSGKDTYADNDYFNGTFELTQKILPGLTAVLAGNYSDRLTETRSIGASISRATTSSPAVAPTALGVWTSFGPDRVNPAVTQWKSVGYNWGFNRTHKYITQARFDLSYEFTVFGNKQNILVGITDQKVLQTSLGTAQVTSNITGGTNTSFRPFTADYFTYQGELNRPTTDTVFTEWDTGQYAIYQGKWWHDRITTIGGVRKERYMVRQLQYSYAKADASLPDSNIANWVRPDAPNAASLTNGFGQAPIVNGYRFGGKPIRDTSLTGGLSVALSKAINLYAVTAGGLFPNTGQRDGFANPFQPESTQSKEIGLKFDLMKNSRGKPKISATVSWFKVERDNAIYNVFWAPQPRSNNQTTLRSGYTTAANTLASGTGPNAYTVTNSAFSTFQTDKPVTYLVQTLYIPTADLNHPRITGAPQASGFMLIDYASLGSAATDPLRRTLDAAAADPNNFTALSGGDIGTGPSGLHANNAYLNRNSDVAYSDKSQGADAQIYLNFTENFSTVITYTHLVQAVTGGFQIVDQPSSTEYDSWWRYMGYNVDQARALGLNEAKGDVIAGAIGRRTNDTPRNSWAIWNRYGFSSGKLRGLDLGLGATFNGPRLSEVTLDNGLRDRSNVVNLRYKPQVPLEYKINMAIGYRARIFDREWYFRLNINNVLDQQKLVGTGSTSLTIDPATGALSTAAGSVAITVPERVVRYFEPRTFRLSVNTQF